jgi:selenophosphate synthase
MKTADLNRFGDLLVSVTEADLIADVTLGGRLVLSQSEELTVCYAPFDYIQLGARLAIVGITPGAQQAQNALVEARQHPPFNFLLSVTRPLGLFSASKVLAKEWPRGGQSPN